MIDQINWNTARTNFNQDNWKVVHVLADGSAEIKFNCGDSALFDNEGNWIRSLNWEIPRFANRVKFVPKPSSASIEEGQLVLRLNAADATHVRTVLGAVGGGTPKPFELVYQALNRVSPAFRAYEGHMVINDQHDDYTRLLSEVEEILK